MVERPTLPDTASGPVSADRDFFTTAVNIYWRMFKPHIGIMVAIDQLAATQPRFALLQQQFRCFGMDIVGASVRTAQRQGLRRRTGRRSRRAGDRPAVRAVHQRQPVRGAVR